jgi:hypothetical protein
LKKGERPSTLREVLRALVIALLIITGVLSLLGASLFAYVLVSKHSLSLGLGAIDVGIGPIEYDSNKWTHFGQPFITSGSRPPGEICMEPNIDQFTLWEVRYLLATCRRWDWQGLPQPVPTFPVPLPPVGPGTVPVPYPVWTAEPPALPVPTR